jgi:hypothetical protein
LRRETRSLLGDEVDALSRRLAGEMADVAVKRAQLDAREESLRASYLDSLVTLVGRYAPGPFGPEVRRLLDGQPELRRRLGVGVDEIERRVLRLR